MPWGCLPSAMASSHGFKAAETGLCCSRFCCLQNLEGGRTHSQACPLSPGWVAVAEPPPRGLGWQLLGCLWWVLP